MKLWISGSIARDLIMDFPGQFRDFIEPKKIHVLNLSFAVEKLRENFGGTAANISYNLALLRERPELLANIGRDQLPLLARLEKIGAAVRHVKISQMRLTAAAYIITDLNDNQLTGFYAGAMNEARAVPRVSPGDWAVIAAESPDNMVRLAKWYARRRVNYIFDPGQQITALSRQDLRVCITGARILIGNDYEIAIIKKRAKVMVPVVVRTLGPQGSEISLAGEKKIVIGIAKPRRVVDPTGAGDAYRAGFLKGLVLGYNSPRNFAEMSKGGIVDFSTTGNVTAKLRGLKTCGQLGATVASYAVEEHGTQNHSFTKAGVSKRYLLNFKEALNL